MGLISETQREADLRDKRASMRHEMDRKLMYHPVFCLTEVPDAYWAKIAFGEHDRTLGGDGYLEISSIKTTSFEAQQRRQSEALATKFDNPPDYDFIDYTVDQVYDFYKSHLRPADNSTKRPHFATFTFAVVDEKCLRSEPQQLIICSDAPDFGEADNAIILKQVRVKATIAYTVSVRLEELTFTPKEAELRVRDLKDANFMALEMGPPPPRLVPVADPCLSAHETEDDGGVLYSFATPAQARAKKRAGIKAAESEGWVPGRGWAD